jgi:hypothetical protein
MGKTTKILLVILFTLLSKSYADIDVNQYQQFWYWAGTKYQPILKDAKVVYLHRGQIDGYKGKSYFKPQSGQGVITSDQQFWLVFRNHTLEWNESIYREIARQLAQWKKEGGNVIGIQIDYDVPTQKLAEYIQFLKKLRAWLSEEYQLSITGLLDWSRYANLENLAQLGDVIDELVIQTYQKRNTIPNYADYLQNMEKMPFSFKVGIAQRSDWVNPEYLEKLQGFSGYVVFLQNE